MRVNNSDKHESVLRWIFCFQILKALMTTLIFVESLIITVYTKLRKYLGSAT